MTPLPVIWWQTLKFESSFAMELGDKEREKNQKCLFDSFNPLTHECEAANNDLSNRHEDANIGE